MKKLILMAAAVVRLACAETYLLTYELAPGVDLAHPTPTQAAALQGHGKSIKSLEEKHVILVAGHTKDTVHPTGIVIFIGDESGARAMAAEDPAAKAGVMIIKVAAFNMVVAPRGDVKLLEAPR